ncbi:hypothetical protein KSP24_03050 [Paenibacillus sp. AK121]|uniref:hypothetical protein n=1 Tax=Paenibacillus sp. AK121 TaxID=2849670 RepID=UPI001C21C97C|nr:hypothetical protein [Paenibacillus sp. AK121]MBU9705903.1 hypothetical protein [Paenibacillus sp. AK121]
MDITKIEMLVIRIMRQYGSDNAALLSELTELVDELHHLQAGVDEIKAELSKLITKL